MEPTQQSSLPFLDTLVTIEPDYTFSTTVYRKPTHTDQYLHWDSNHHITAKQSLYNTLTYRSKIVSSTHDKNGQGTPTHKDNTTTLSVSRIGPQPMATQIHPPQPAQHHHHHHHHQQQQQQQQQQEFISQQYKEHHHCSSIHAQHRRKVQENVQKERNTSTLQGHQHIKDSNRKPQGKGPQKNQRGIIYHYQCPQINCPSAYIGESGRTLGERVKEHFKASSTIHLHSTTTGHPMDAEQFNIVHKEVNSHFRTITEAMFIHVQDPALNRNLGKYQLPHI